MSPHFITLFNIQHEYMLNEYIKYNKHVFVGAPVLATVNVDMNIVQSLIATSIGCSRNISIMNWALYCYELASVTTTTNPKQINNN